MTNVYIVRLAVTHYEGPLDAAALGRRIVEAVQNEAKEDGLNLSVSLLSSNEAETLERLRPGEADPRD